MTYNIFGARLTDGRELAKSIKKYKPDFIGLQEVDRNTKRSKFRDVIQEMAQELGYNYYYFQKAMDFDNGEYGIAFISKYDVKFIYIHELPGNSKEKRQVLAAKLNLGRFNKKILVVNTHLDNKMDNKHEELNNLFSVINKFRGDLKFLCGDFNLLPTTEHYEKIRETWNDSYFEGKDLHGNKNEAKRDLETARIDYIMVQKDASYKVKESFYINDNSRDWTKLSDHLPYMAVFELK
ncbi:endonuclease/exonuclease/phosphatase family protein [Leptotrichia sp. oral taxon 218]|uniref:endonuclease/exonuclease/phosphatase family protein n=1 Tax=Leptotrichia sp. oral taxon 218 TaxID=712361 RepID=UPI0020137480|nr:endonuclease/exonuclease/phosphatase family protein [Leptotrichia sp. oral taxon 218]